MHRDASYEIEGVHAVPAAIVAAGQHAWESAVRDGEEYGVRNSQASVLAPTGTIGLMMDCDTTGIEPDLGLCKMKKLVGGGTMVIVNQTIPRALRRLGYNAQQVDEIIAYIDREKSILGAPHLAAAHVPVFACSMGDNVIHYEGHVRMMGATQPFLSGAISKTVNMPEEATIEEIEQLHLLSWQLGLKAVAVYRDNCKVGQPLSTAKKDGAGYVINGHKAVVVGAPWATHLIVTARTGGSQREESGVSVFIVEKNAKGVTTRDYPTVDGQRASEVYFENVSVGADALIGAEGAALPLVNKVIDEATAALCAEAVGAMRQLHTGTLEYAKQRKQFGVAIATFQVLQHRMVDMFMNVEQSVSMTYMATIKVTDDAERAKAVSAAKVQIGKACKFVGQNAIQIHGGMGMTDELAIGHYFKRATMIEGLFGSVDHHLRRYETLSFGKAA
jgi:ribonucleotide reductase alpha subunit